ncbi:hypothetical protein Pcinc_039626, partial [Petrolisthes cinctipes]
MEKGEGGNGESEKEGVVMEGGVGPTVREGGRQKGKRGKEAGGREEALAGRQDG